MIKELSVGFLEDESGLPKPSQYLHTKHRNLLCTLSKQKTLLISLGSCFFKNKVPIDITQMNFFIFGLEKLNRSLFARSCFLRSRASVSSMNPPWPVDQLVLWAPTGCQAGFVPHHRLCCPQQLCKKCYRSIHRGSKDHRAGPGVSANQQPSPLVSAKAGGDWTFAANRTPC